MAAAAGAYVMKNALVTINSVEYANQVRIARLVPDQPVQTYRTLVPDGTQTDTDSPAWKFQLTGLQINRTGGLAKALRALTLGQIVPVILAPNNTAGDDQASFDIRVIAMPFGGEQGSFAELDGLEFPVIGQPTFEAID